MIVTRILAAVAACVVAGAATAKVQTRELEHRQGATDDASWAAATAVLAQASAAAPKGAPFEMDSYQLVLLMRAPTWKKLPDDEAKALQAAHIGHLTRMGEAGKAVVCGPFDDQRDPAFRGACIYAVATPEEARALAADDPAVKAGQLRVEVMTWWVGKGYMTFPKAPPSTAR
jgi:uncharacterized protein YciI